MKKFKLNDSPFRPAAADVAVCGGAGAYRNVREALSKFDLSPAKGLKVLLKPNVGRMAAPDSGVNCSPGAVAAAIDAFRGSGAIPSVGESPITGVSTMAAFEMSGIAAEARSRGCPLIDMDARQAVEVSVPEGLAIRKLKLCPELLEFDIVVSMPVMKMHMHTVATLAIKNMKGCLWRRSKVELHMLPPLEGSGEKPINVAIADMSGILKPHLSIIDGWVCMEGLGPGAGTPKRMDIALVGIDPFLTDAVACGLMGIKADDVPHLRLGARRGYGDINLGSAKISPDDWRSFGAEFQRPPSNLSFEFPGIEVLDKNSCSACQSTLLLFLKSYAPDLLKASKDGKAVIAIGKGHESVPIGCLCLGNCTARHKGHGVFVKGCPPVSSQILEALTGSPSVDSADAKPSQ